MRKIIKLPKKTSLDYERPVQDLPEDYDEPQSEELSDEDQVSRYLKKGKFYKNLKEEEKEEILAQIRADEEEDEGESEVVEPSPAKKVGHLAWMMGAFSSKGADEKSGTDPEKLVTRQVPSKKKKGNKSLRAEGTREQQQRSERLKNLKLSAPKPNLSQILDKEEMLSDDVEDRWEEQRFVVPMGWFVLLGIAICAVGIWAVYGVFQAETSPEQSNAAKHAIALAKEQDDLEARETLEAMQECVTSYLAAGSVDAMLPWVRHPDRVGPLMRDYYRTHKRWRTRFDRFERIRSVSFGKRPFVYVQAVVEKGKPRHLFLEQVAPARFLVDWESEVIYQPMAWKEYVKKRPLTPMHMRVRVQKDDFYTHAFRDRTRYQCYKLTSLGSDDYLFGYIERGSDLEERMESFLMRLAGKTEDQKLMGESETDEEDTEEDEEDLLAAIDIDLSLDAEPELEEEKPEAMILSLRFLRDDESKRGVLIDALVSERWLYADPPESP
ncbi:hypothetical protein HW115_16775 [Verrucomicrobiaceae bacterium N1E253]|uniref:Uncharacterized protein n=1 Tax=Oceaniferula marina TaxID=2748318 RepID=A0A851GJD0_9BACT|nr:hypothetical protein [Oceaniferula marina]NWK57279.1 hypothetical protein [Oceaniferula marina]